MSPQKPQKKTYLFKVGDRVVRTEGEWEGFKKGDTGVVTYSYNEYGTTCITVKLDKDGKEYSGNSAESLELIGHPHKFQGGGTYKIVKYKASNGQYEPTHSCIGKEVTIKEYLGKNRAFPYYCSDGINRGDEELELIPEPQDLRGRTFDRVIVDEACTTSTLTRESFDRAVECLRQNSNSVYYPLPSSASYGYSLYKQIKNIKNKTMFNIKDAIRRIKRTEPEKTFVKVGFLNEFDEITPEGKDALTQILWELNKEALKKLADQILEEVKTK